jgi:hypothetical protein
MVDAALEPALTEALRCHEIGGDPAMAYRLTFAGKGTSGGSFGFMQGDLAKGGPAVKDTFRQVLAAAGVAPAQIDALLALCAVPQPHDPLTDAQRTTIDAALAARKDLVDAMDRHLLETVLDDLDLCLDAAQAAGCTLTPKAQLYIAMWSNMTGRPDTLAAWLKGTDPHFGVPVPAAGKIVDGAALEAYLSATRYYREHPRNLGHLKDCAAKGVAKFPPDAAVA